MRLLYLTINNLAHLCCSFTGLAMMFILTGIYELHRKVELHYWLIQIGNLCFGVYLLQQFILMGLYRYTSLPKLCGPYLLPWGGFIIALTFSLLGAFLLRKTRVGRFLIG